MRQLQVENAAIAWYDLLLCSVDVVQDGIPCDHGQSVVESTSLQGFPSEIRHRRRYRDGQFAVSKGNALHKSSCSALSHFQLIDTFLLMWVPDAGTVLQLGTDDSFVSLFLQVLRTLIQNTSEKAQHAICGRNDLINLLVPVQSAVHHDSYTVNHKKRDILFLTITLANLNGFLHFLHHFNREEILHATVVKFTTSP